MNVINQAAGDRESDSGHGEGQHIVFVDRVMQPSDGAENCVSGEKSSLLSSRHRIGHLGPSRQDIVLNVQHDPLGSDILVGLRQLVLIENPTRGVPFTRPSSSDRVVSATSRSPKGAAFVMGPKWIQVPDRICEWCRQPFARRKGRDRQTFSRQRFCSHECRIKGVRRTPEQRFWEKVDKNGPVPQHHPELGPCWVWLGSRRSNNGYGGFRLGGKYGRVESTHRVAWEIANRPLAPGEHVLHRCDNPLCVRPDHLFLGTHQQNMADRQEKGRVNRGSRHPRAVIDEAAVLLIRRRAASGKSGAAIARSLGCSPNVTTDVIRGRTWKHVV